MSWPIFFGLDALEVEAVRELASHHPLLTPAERAVLHGVADGAVMAWAV